ncbi:hypothetical protein [Tenacibaculum singaporense]|uniref:Uncharacterized protein n=1 Tax=Tenacibaculum singaporense TaxID=2358479 RepID=A0A3S8R3Y1_9FLAO|nr:hypothetical protein [Tenacibaculum singaporense]AZJ34553.1 hypothetical protein D6T69_03005 [Tenacibaculum singaporense]
MKKIIDIEDLLEYLKIPEFKEKGSQEVILKKITQQASYEEEAMQIRVFQQAYKEASIPQTLYIDENNVAYTLHGFSSGEVFYKNISYDKDDRVFDKEELANLKEVRIPDEIFNQGYEFYINEENHLVAVIFATYASSSNDYISYKPSTFLYVKEYTPIVTYHYTNVYGESANEKIKIESENTGGLLHRFPILSRSGARGEYTYQLSYYYKKDSNEVRRVVPAEEDYPFMGIRIHFKDLTTVLSFLNQTIFYYYDEFNDFRSKWRSYFLVEVTAHIVGILNRSGADAKKVALIYHLSQPLYDRFEGSASLWNTLEILAKGYVRNNLSINDEDLILKLLKIIYHRYTHKQVEETFGNRVIKTEKEKQHIAGINNEFISNLITRKVDGKLLLYKLVKGLDGEHFQTYVYFIWKIWKSSSYADINPETNKLINITEKSPVLLDYRSDTALGFHYDNAQINWKGEKEEIDVKVRVKVGSKKVPELINIGDDGKSRFIETGRTEVVDDYQSQQYFYHPFAPIVLINSKTPKFILKEGDDSDTLSFKLPAFVLFANNETAFWQNVLKGSQYLVDIITTVSGIGNILKAGRIYNLLKNGKTLLYKTKQLTALIGAARATTGIIEVSSGTVNTLLKLTELDDTGLGKTTSKYLFYLEMLSLAGEATVFLKNKLSATAKELVENPKFTKSLDDLVKKGEIDEILKTRVLEELSGVKLLETTLNISPFIAKFSKKLPKALDNAPLELKKVEDLILKKVGKIKEIEDQWEYAFIWNKQGHFKTSRPFTSKSNDEVLISRAFGEKEKMTIDRIRMLKGAIITHNHPNFSRFSDDDIKIFLKYGLNELRAINLDGVVYSLKLKKGKSFEKNEIIKIYDSLAVAREKFVLENIMKTQYFEEKVKFQLKYERFEEEYILSKIKDKIEYIIYK